MLGHQALPCKTAVPLVEKSGCVSAVRCPVERCSNVSRQGVFEVSVAKDHLLAIFCKEEATVLSRGQGSTSSTCN